MPELNIIYAESPGWARAYQIGGDEGDEGTQKSAIRVNQGETLVAAPSFENRTSESFSQISAQLRNEKGKVIYELSAENPYFILNAEQDEELQLVVSSNGASAFSFNISAFGKRPHFFSSSPLRCQICKITAHALAAAILLGVTATLAAAVASFLAVALPLAHLIIEILKDLALAAIIDELCKFLGLCPSSAIDYLRIKLSEAESDPDSDIYPIPEPLPA